MLEQPILSEIPFNTQLLPHIWHRFGTVRVYGRFNPRNNHKYARICSQASMSSAFTAGGSWHLWQQTHENTPHLHVRVPPRYARAAVLISTSVRTLFHLSWPPEAATFPFSFASTGRRRRFLIYLMWKYFISASAGCTFETPPVVKAGSFNWKGGLPRGLHFR